jgi:hypothetical protein
VIYLIVDAVLHLALPATGSVQISDVLGRLSLRERGLAVAADPIDDVAELARRAAAERDATGAQLVLLSGPALLGGGPLGPDDARCFRPGAADAVATALAGVGAGRARVVLDVRRQDRLMEHAHLHAVRNGSAVPFAEQFPRADEPVLDWQDLADRVAAVPGVAEVVLRPVEAFRARPDLLAADLVGRTGLAEPVAVPAVQFPPTFSARGVRVARALNAHVRPEEQGLVRDFVAENFPGPPVGNQFLRAQTRARILAAYAAVNRTLFRARLPELPEDAYTDDVRTAALASREMNR